MTPIRALPPGYRETRRVVLTDDRLLLRLNLWGFVPLAVSALAMLAWATVAGSFLAPVPPGPDVPWWLSLILALLVLPLHELVHAALILAVGHRPRLGVKLDKGVLYATADQALFTRNQYLAVALSPLIVISLLGALGLLVLSSGWWWTVGLAVALNAGGAIGDLWVSAQIARAPSSALVRDTEDGYVLYEREVTSDEQNVGS
jgi:hypothetical protein